MSNLDSASQLAGLLAGIRAGEPLAIGRAITAIENQSGLGRELVRGLSGTPRKSISVGITGAPGAGKSSLINALLAEFARREIRIGVISVDPSSRRTGGAVLGDRVRMADHSKNPRIFIRSLGSRGHLGGLTSMTAAVLDVMNTAGMDLIFVETVGAGQSDVEIAELVDLTLVLCPPGLGDGMQAIKAGILEVADLLVVNKSDLPGADQAVTDLKAMLRWTGDEDHRSVMRTDARLGTGVEALANEISVRVAARGRERAGRQPTAGCEIKRRLADKCASWVRQRILRSDDPRVAHIALQIETGELDPEAGLRELLAVTCR